LVITVYLEVVADRFHDNQVEREGQSMKNTSVPWHIINEMCAFSDIENLNPVQRIAYLSYWYMTAVEMGGHLHYFTDRINFDQQEVIRALQTIGANEQASLLAKAVATVAANGGDALKGAENYELRLQAIDLTQFDDSFDRCQKKIPECLLAYAESHRRDFV
jgi:hypothetical protein